MLQVKWPWNLLMIWELVSHTCFSGSGSWRSNKFYEILIKRFSRQKAKRGTVNVVCRLVVRCAQVAVAVIMTTTAAVGVCLRCFALAQQVVHFMAGSIAFHAYFAASDCSCVHAALRMGRFLLVIRWVRFYKYFSKPSPLLRMLRMW